MTFRLWRCFYCKEGDESGQVFQNFGSSLLSYCQQVMDNCIDILDMANKHICTFCVKSIISSRKLATHLLTHTGEKSPKCAQRNKSFRLAAHLKNHLICHTEAKMHPCAQCDKSSRHAGNLKTGTHWKEKV